MFNRHLYQSLRDDISDSFKISLQMILDIGRNAKVLSMTAVKGPYFVFARADILSLMKCKVLTAYCHTLKLFNH